MAEKRILYFIPEVDISSDGVYQSQVMGQAAYLSQRGYKCLAVGFVNGDGNIAEFKQYVNRRYGVDVAISSRNISGIPFYSKWLRARNAYSQFRKMILNFHPTHVYFRSPISFLGIGGKLRKQCIPCIVDMRGVADAEVELVKSRKSFYYYGLSWLQHYTMKKADRLSCVSHRMGKWIKSQTGRSDYTVIPCCVSKTENTFDMDERIRTRAHLGYLPNHKVICYAGGVAEWQKLRSIIKLFRDISKLHSDYRFLFICRQKEKIEAMLRDIVLDVRISRVVSCEQFAVSGYLKACDASIIMRDDILVNNVSSPVKIGEYLYAGLPVLLTKGIGDMSELIPIENVGIIIDENNRPAEQIIRYLSKIKYEEMFIRCQAFVEKYLTFDAYAGEFEKLYA